MNLYEISANYKEALEKLDSIDDITPEIIEDSLVLLKDDLDKKIINVVAYIRNLEYKLDAMENYEARMYLRCSRLKKKIERLKEYIKFNLQQCNVMKVEGAEFDVLLRKCPPKLVIEEDKLATGWFTTVLVRTVNKERIKEALNRKEPVEGAHLEQGLSLIIK